MTPGTCSRLGDGGYAGTVAVHVDGHVAGTSEALKTPLTMLPSATTLTPGPKVSGSRTAVVTGTEA